MTYTVVVHKSRYGFDVRCPALPGCCSQGATEKEALENIKDAISTYLEMLRKETAGKKTVRVTVPRHSRLNPYTVRSILRAAQISARQFKELL